MANKTGRIMKQLSNDYFVQVDDEIIPCKPRGKFRNMGISPLVGDYVDIDYDNRYILEIHERRNSLIRPAIANVTQAIIVNSVEVPEFSSNLLDKLLVIMENHHIKPILCFTKMDIVSEEIRKEIESIMNYYRNIGYQVYLNSDEELKKVFKDNVTVFAGQSGSGKSTLLNMLDNSLELQTGEVSYALGRGRHTTRYTSLMPLYGGYVADTPGFSALDFKDYTNQEIRDGFIEFEQYKESCKYRDCMHLDEEECRVKEALKDGEILSSRYENYLKLLEKR